MPFLKTLIFTIVVPGTATVWIPYALLSSREKNLSWDIGGWRLAGILPILLGTVTYLWCAWDFASAGRGTPAPIDPPKVVISRGLYTMVRNPMYVGVTLILLGEAILFRSGILLRYALILWVVFHLVVVFYEEPTLKRKFGAAYEAYLKAVPRWIPRLRT